MFGAATENDLEALEGLKAQQYEIQKTRFIKRRRSQAQ